MSELDKKNLTPEGIAMSETGEIEESILTLGNELKANTKNIRMHDPI